MRGQCKLETVREMRIANTLMRFAEVEVRNTVSQINPFMLMTLAIMKRNNNSKRVIRKLVYSHHLARKYNFVSLDGFASFSDHEKTAFYI